MNYYATGAAVSFVLLIMGIISLVIGFQNYYHNSRSASSRLMFYCCALVCVWDAGYGMMGLCYQSDFAYVPRAIALIAVYAYVHMMVLYVCELGGLNKHRMNRFLLVSLVVYVIAWFDISSEAAVTFVQTSWGYWYYSNKSYGRILQFAAVLYVMASFYIALNRWNKKVHLERERNIINRFKLFGPVIFAGYIGDALIPTIAHTPAVPGSAVGAFIATMMLYGISLKYKAFGASVNNVSEYVFREVKTPVIVLNYADEVVLYNDLARELFGFDDNSNEVQRITGIERVDEYEDEIYRLEKNGHYCKFERSVIYDSFGEVLHVIIFAVDVTSNIEATQMAIEAKRLAEEANISKSNFLANMSHEIRTPMNAIIGMSDILLKEDISDEERNQLNNIKVAADGLLGIINDILDLSKIESGKIELIEDEYSLPSLINDVSTIISVRLQETGIKLDIEVPEDFPEKVYGDEVRVRQIIMNIMGNACKYTKKGNIKLKCEYRLEGSECRLYFHVSDTGMGIKEEDIDKIFGAFNQVDTRKNRNVQGTGLGLAISKNLAELMKGDITVDSIYGEGSTFHIKIVQRCDKYAPVGEKVAKALNACKYRNHAAEEELVIVPRPDKKVLVVDDIPINLIVARGLMKPYKMQLDVAESGEKAIEMVQAKDYDLVFMDHMMPEMDGVDTMLAIRALGGKYENLVIIALTANAVGDAKDMLIEAGMQDFLAKPIEKKELNTIINRWL